MLHHSVRQWVGSLWYHRRRRFCNVLVASSFLRVFIIFQASAICSSLPSDGRNVCRRLHTASAMLQPSVRQWVGSYWYRRRSRCCNVVLLQDVLIIDPGWVETRSSLLGTEGRDVV